VNVLAKKELFIKRVYEIVQELKIPLIDERVYNKVTLKEERPTVSVSFLFEEDESVIRGFLGLAEYFHTVVIKNKERFLISVPDLLFKLESK
jgi:hypothetical protein